MSYFELIQSRNLTTALHSVTLANKQNTSNISILLTQFLHFNDPAATAAAATVVVPRCNACCLPTDPGGTLSRVSQRRGQQPKLEAKLSIISGELRP
jgi:hypothetical protein